MASPHIAGLLAYYLSLAPAKDSEFAVSDLTPAKLKKALIDVASKDLLSDIPSDTPNLLAWNGGGSDNISAIFDGSAEKALPKTGANLKMEKVVKHISEETEALLEDLEKEVIGMLKGVRKALH
jgi:cerevisin